MKTTKKPAPKKAVKTAKKPAVAVVPKDDETPVSRRLAKKMARRERQMRVGGAHENS